MARKNGKIHLGDRFMKLGSIKTLWEVSDLLDLRDLPPHLHLREVGGHREVTYGVSAVLDKRLFQRVETNAKEQLLERSPSETQQRVHSLFGAATELPAAVDARH